ncbi:copper resistance protein CopC [Streptomyces sp. NPDC008196]|uniref:copper resistance CopC family protein n=1 Tax=Streptomyces sp. NPDC008196 TaxID=3364819 RepID=UPI0036E8435E
MPGATGSACDFDPACLRRAWADRHLAPTAPTSGESCCAPAKRCSGYANKRPHLPHPSRDRRSSKGDLTAPTVRRSLTAVGSFLSLAVALLLGTAAAAHATLLFTSPTADATVADSSKSLALVFDQPVSLNGSSVLEPSARLGKAALSQGDQAVTVPVRSTLPEGVHTIDWQVTARDGDVMTGGYRFAVGPRTVALTSGQATAAKDANPTAILRWLLSMCAPPARTPV